MKFLQTLSIGAGFIVLAYGVVMSWDGWDNRDGWDVLAERWEARANSAP